MEGERVEGMWGRELAFIWFQIRSNTRLTTKDLSYLYALRFKFPSRALWFFQPNWRVRMDFLDVIMDALTTGTRVPYETIIRYINKLCHKNRCKREKYLLKHCLDLTARNFQGITFRYPGGGSGFVKKKKNILEIKKYVRCLSIFAGKNRVTWSNDVNQSIRNDMMS